MERLALPATSLKFTEETPEFTVLPFRCNKGYIIRAWGEELSYPHSQIAELHEFAAQPPLSEVLGWLGIVSARIGTQHVVEIPRLDELLFKVEIANQHLDYPIPLLAHCGMSTENNHLAFHRNAILPVRELVLQTTGWRAWHNTVHDLVTHAVGWILAPKEVHLVSQMAAQRAQDATSNIKADISEAIDDLYAIDGIGSYMQAAGFQTVKNNSNYQSVQRTFTHLLGSSPTEKELVSLWEASQNRLQALTQTVRTIQSSSNTTAP